jgi:hypothetical protein
MAIGTPFSCEIFPDSTVNLLAASFTEAVAGLAVTRLPAPLAERPDER